MIVKTTMYILNVNLSDPESGLLRTLYQQARNAQLPVQVHLGSLEVQGALRPLMKFMEQYADVLEMGDLQLQPEQKGIQKIKPG